MTDSTSTVLTTSVVILGFCGGALAGSVSVTIDQEWIIATPIISTLSLPAVQSIDSIVVQIAHAIGSDLAISVDGSVIAGDFDFDLMFQETANGSPFSMGAIPGSGALANVADYTFVASGGGDYSAPHTPSGILNANTWIGGPQDVQDYSLFIVDLNLVFDGGAIGTWTINYTPVPSPASVGLLAMFMFFAPRRRR